MRFKVRRLNREKKLTSQASLSKQLLAIAEPEVEVFYEKALTELSEPQHTSVESFVTQTTAISELNLIYLRRKMGDPVIREKRTGLVASATVNNGATVTAATPPSPNANGANKEAPAVDYAQRHVVRAKTYIASKCFPEAVQELRDAVRIEPENSNYHTMLGQAYLMQKMVGMAKVHVRQALKLDPNNHIAHKYAKQLQIEIVPPKAPSNGQHNGRSQPQKGGFFSFFTRNRAAK